MSSTLQLQIVLFRVQDMHNNNKIRARNLHSKYILPLELNNNSGPAQRGRDACQPTFKYTSVDTYLYFVYPCERTQTHKKKTARIQKPQCVD